MTYSDYFEYIQKLDLTWQQRELVMMLWARYCGLPLSENVINQDDIDQILPVYGDKDCMLVIHADDYSGKKIDDTLCIQLIPSERKIGKPWSMAKMLKFSAYDPIYRKDDIIRAKQTLMKKYSKKQLSRILFNLENPTMDEYNSLIAIPDRLKGYNPI